MARSGPIYSPYHHIVDIQQEDVQSRSEPLNQIPPLAPSRTIDRQVSLETGFTVLSGNRKGVNGNGKDRKGGLRRSGKSVGMVGINEDGVSQSPKNNKGDFSMFRTKSTLVKQMSLAQPKKEHEGDTQNNRNSHSGNINNENNGAEESEKNVPAAGRYFAALRGPELDEVRDSEDILLPKDELWPFLLRFPINTFGITLGLSSQAILWNSLASSPATSFLHITPVINLIIWILALTVLVFVSIAYSFKCIFYFHAIRREYSHPVRVNFFFAPWVTCMFLTIGAPHAFTHQNLKLLHKVMWCVFIVPIFILDLKIYGQWLSGGKRRLSKVANPSSHLSVVGNFVGAILAAKVGWQEAGRFWWAIGLAHYLVVFVTLYQRLPTSEALPKELHPVYSMFIATPSAASIAWKAAYGEFDGVSRTFFFIALFLYTSLVVRINFFRGFKFSLAWWSYTFPMTTVSVAAILYAEAVPCFFSKGLALSLSFMSSAMVFVLFWSTVLHALVFRTLFPNDLAIAITVKKQYGPRFKEKEKKQCKMGNGIKRWAKESSISLITSIARKHSADKDSDEK